MRQSRTLRAGALVAVGAVVAVLVTATAWGKPLLNERIHDEGAVVFEDFCGVVGFDVEIAFVFDARLLAVARGPDGLAYFIERGKETSVVRNLANPGPTVTAVTTSLNQDMKVTDNGDGTLTILAKGTGNEVFYGPDGDVIARNPGQTRVEILIDHGGTPEDPFDDEFLGVVGVVKGSTGRTDDICAAMVEALT